MAEYTIKFYYDGVEKFALISLDSVHKTVIATLCGLNVQLIRCLRKRETRMHYMPDEGDCFHLESNIDYDVVLKKQDSPTIESKIVKDVTKYLGFVGAQFSGKTSLLNSLWNFKGAKVPHIYPLKNMRVIDFSGASTPCDEYKKLLSFIVIAVATATSYSEAVQITSALKKEEKKWPSTAVMCITKLDTNKSAFENPKDIIKDLSLRCGIPEEAIFACYNATAAGTGSWVAPVAKELCVPNVEDFHTWLKTKFNLLN